MKKLQNLFGAVGILFALGGLQSARADGTIHVLVEDCKGNPVSGSYVLIAKPDGIQVDRGTTNGSGLLTFKIDEGTYHVTVVCPNGKMIGPQVVIVRKGGVYNRRFQCPCTPSAGSATSGVEGAWSIQGTDFGSATLKFDTGQFELSITNRGRTLLARGTYRQVQSSPDHPNDVVAAIYQGQGINGVQLLMAEVDVCGAEAAKEMHGVSPLFATADNPHGVFIARRANATLQLN